MSYSLWFCALVMGFVLAVQSKPYATPVPSPAAAAAQAQLF
ncbi:MAG: hypothetical protein R6W06_13400 [Prochlorococcaceae cyanobacterium]